MKQPFSVLKQFVRDRPNQERCDLCSAPLRDDHPHLVEPVARQLLCACSPCALLFADREDSKFKRIPGRIRILSDFKITDGEWESMMIPIGMAFFFRSAHENRIVCLYPSPAGPTESLLPLSSWDEIVQNNPVLKDMMPDVEALLVNRVASTKEYYLVPIDRCYMLVGLIRMQWRGLSGGNDVWEGIRQFFNELKKGTQGRMEGYRA